MLPFQPHCQSPEKNPYPKACLFFLLLLIFLYYCVKILKEKDRESKKEIRKWVFRFCCLSNHCQFHEKNIYYLSKYCLCFLLLLISYYCIEREERSREGSGGRGERESKKEIRRWIFVSPFVTCFPTTLPISQKESLSKLTGTNPSAISTNPSIFKKKGKKKGKRKEVRGGGG